LAFTDVRGYLPSYPGQVRDRGRMDIMNDDDARKYWLSLFEEAHHRLPQDEQELVVWTASPEGRRALDEDRQAAERINKRFGSPLNVHPPHDERRGRK
jgi:hypothetical protein